MEECYFKLQSETLIHVYFSRILNCIDSTKSRKTSHIITRTIRDIFIKQWRTWRKDAAEELLISRNMFLKRHLQYVSKSWF